MSTESGPFEMQNSNWQNISKKSIMESVPTLPVRNKKSVI